MDSIDDGHCKTLVTIAYNMLLLFGDDEAEKHLGSSGRADQTLASSLWCFWKYPNSYKKAVTTAIKMGGDADTRGAIVGALVGSRVGVDNIPKEYIERVEQSDLLTALDKILWIGPTPELKKYKELASSL